MFTCPLVVIFPEAICVPEVLSSSIEGVPL
jgi:hypothetical protein